jgi:hypothetical protein
MVGNIKPSMAAPTPNKPQPGVDSPTTRTKPMVTLDPNKPKFKGTFVGQVAKQGRSTVDKKVAYPDALTGAWQRRKVQGWGPEVEWVWNGEDWVKPGAFKHGGPVTPKMGEGVHEVLMRTFLEHCGNPGAHVNEDPNAPLKSDDESEDIEDLGTAGDVIDGIEKDLSALRHLLGDVEEHEKEEASDEMPELESMYAEAKFPWDKFPPIKGGSAGVGGPQGHTNKKPRDVSKIGPQPTKAADDEKKLSWDEFSRQDRKAAQAWVKYAGSPPNVPYDFVSNIYGDWFALKKGTEKIEWHWDSNAMEWNVGDDS